MRKQNLTLNQHAGAEKSPNPQRTRRNKQLKQRGTKATASGGQPLPMAVSEEHVRLLVRWPGEHEVFMRLKPQDIRERLFQALIAERRKGRLGSWSYDPARHRNLLHAIDQLKPKTILANGTTGSLPNRSTNEKRRPAKTAERRLRSISDTRRR